MAQLDRETLKEFFEAGDFPTEAQFADFIDSVLNFIDDGNAVFLTGNQTIADAKSFTEGITVDQALSYLAANGVKFGTGDTVIYENSNGALRIMINGVVQHKIEGAFIQSNTATGYRLRNTGATATKCTVMPSQASPTTGLGSSGIDQLSNIAGGVEVIRCIPTGAYIQVIKSGATQAAAGANAGEMWETSGHATLPDNVIMRGV